MEVFEIPNSRATWAIGFPLVCASRTASRLNSAVEVFCTFFILVHPLSEVVYLKGFLTPRIQGKLNLPTRVTLAPGPQARGSRPGRTNQARSTLETFARYRVHPCLTA